MAIDTKGKRFSLGGSFTKESAALARIQELEAMGRYAFMETTPARYFGSKKRHNRYNVWVRID